MIYKILTGCYIVAALVLVAACNDGLDIQTKYPFTVETMPVPKELKVNETAEIRCELKREGRWEDTRYTIRWFLFDGEGTLKLDDGTALLPNDRYPLEKETFRLYYTPLSDEQSGFTVWVEDSDGQAVELEFDFNADNDKEDGYGLVLYLDIPEFFEALHASKWRTDIVLPQAGDNICPENLLSEKTLAMLETVSAGEVWEDMKDDCRTMRRVVEHELFRVTERGFHLRRDGTPCCTLTLQRYRVHDAGRRMKTEVPPPCPARGVERKSGKIRFYFRKYFVHIDVPDTLPQYPEVREFVNIKSLLSEADRKLLAETECDEAESLLEWIENEGYCHVRARCWTPDEESGGWMCVLSVDV